MCFEILTASLILYLLGPILLAILLLLSLRVCDGPIIQESEWCWLTVMLSVPVIVILAAVWISCCCVSKTSKKVLVAK
jgi:hypothetical protein